MEKMLKVNYMKLYIDRWDYIWMYVRVGKPATINQRPSLTQCIIMTMFAVLDMADMIAQVH